MRRFLCLYLVGFGTLLSVVAGESPWRASIGVTYRHFGDVEVDSVGLRNHDRMMTPGGPFGIQGYSTLPGLADGSGVTADQVRFHGYDDSVGWEFAPTVGIARELWRDGGLSLSLTASFSFFSIGVDMGTAGRSNSRRFSASHYNYLVVGGTVLAPPINDVPLAGFSPGTSATFRLSNFDLDLYVVDVGLRGRLQRDRFYLTAAAGPVFYLADAESRIVEGGSWNAIPGTGDTGGYTKKADDSDLDTEFGIFGSIGAGVDLTERLAVEFELRWDEAFGKVGTSQAVVDLDGVSGILKLVIGF